MLQAHREDLGDREDLGASGLRSLEGQAAWGPSLGTDPPCPEPRGGGGSGEATFSVSGEMSPLSAGLLNTAGPLDAQSPPDDSEDTPNIQSCTATLSPTDRHTQSQSDRALLKHTPPKTLKRWGTCAHCTQPASYRHRQPAQPSHRLRQHNAGTHPHSHPHSDVPTGTLSGFTLSTTEKISVSALWFRGRRKEKWK